MTSRTGLLLALALVAGCNKDKPPAADKPAGSAAGVDVKPEPSEAAPAGSKPTEAKPGEAPPATAAVTWDKFTSKAGGFTIELPGKGEERDQGGIKMVGAEFGATAADPRTSMCGAAFMELPAADDPKTILDGATARHKQDAKVIEDKEITLGKHPGRSLIVQNDSHRKWMRVYLVDKTIYILNCGGPFDRAATDEPLALKALASFALTK